LAFLAPPFRIMPPTPQTTSVSARLVAVLATALVVLLGLAAAASADPTIDSRRTEAAVILGEVDALGAEVGAAAERFNGANYELKKLTAELTDTREDLIRAKQLRAVTQERLADRLYQLYVDGQASGSLEIILGAESLNDLLDRIEATERIAEQDSRLAGQAQDLRLRVAKRQKQLTAARAQQAVVVERRAAERRAIEGNLAERERLLASVKDEIARLEEAERRRQAELRRRAQVELDRQRRLAEVQQVEAETQATESTNTAAASSSAGEQPGEAAGEAAPAPPPVDASKGAQVVAIAMRYLGVPYKWGGASPSTGFDCSGLTMYVYAQVGVSLPHYAAAQYQLGAPVSREQLQPGDLVFYRGLGHMGMYIGGGNYIHAPQTGDVVKISGVYARSDWVGARRVL
jgi:cell wall-associated NlpC family hydrolase